MSGGSYRSSNDPGAHLGTGQAATAEEMEIRWPSHAIEKLKLPSADRSFTIEGGEGIVGETAPNAHRL